MKAGHGSKKTTPNTVRQKKKSRQETTLRELTCAQTPCENECTRWKSIFCLKTARSINLRYGSRRRRPATEAEQNLRYHKLEEKPCCRWLQSNPVHDGSHGSKLGSHIKSQLHRHTITDSKRHVPIEQKQTVKSNAHKTWIQTDTHHMKCIR